MSSDKEASKPKNLRDLGFTDEEIFEIIDFYMELGRLGEKGKRLDDERIRLAAVLRTRTRQLVEIEKAKLIDKIHSLEKFGEF